MRSKFLINNNITDRINTSIYPRCFGSYQNNKDITVKISDFLQTTGNINRTLKPFQLTFRHRASSIQGQAFRYSPEKAFYIFNQQIYFII